MKPNQKQRPQQRKTNLITTNYEMKFETLNDMVKTLVDLHPEMKNILNVNIINPMQLQTSALEYFLKYQPDVVNAVNLPVAITVNANSVSLKTAKFFSIKWNFKYDKSGFIDDVVTTITTFVKEGYKVNDSLLSMIDKLEEQKWKVVNL